MIVELIKTLTTFFSDFFADLFSFFKDDDRSVADDDIRWTTNDSGSFPRNADDESGDELTTHLLKEPSMSMSMHRPPIQDRFGMLRFRVEFSKERQLFRVTIIDAWDLPPMDHDGKADPYVEISLAPGHKKYTTAIKPNSLNPTFNETAEFHIKTKEIEEKELVLKVMDSDFPLQDELIGIIRLPLIALDLSQNSKQYTCLILHEKLKNKNALSLSDAVKFNLKLSEQASTIYDLEVKLKEYKVELESCREELRAVRVENFDLELKNLELKSDLGLDDHDNNVTYSSDSLENTSKSAPTSLRTSPIGLSKEGSVEGVEPVRSDKTFQLMKNLHECLADRSREIAQLKNMILEMSPRLLETGNGLIEIGLAYSPITSELRIAILSAEKLKAVNLLGGLSDPYVKVKAYLGKKEGKLKPIKFETKTIWKSLTPVWNEEFKIKDICDEDLKNMNMEITVLDRGRFRAAQPLGQVRIGPDQTYDCQHWEEMHKALGGQVIMKHSLRDV